MSPTRSSLEISSHYRRKGFTGTELALRLARHADLIRPCDPAVADELERLAAGMGGKRGRAA